MTLSDVKDAFERLGFLCTLHEFEDDGDVRLILHKLRATPGNYVASCQLPGRVDLPDGTIQWIDLDGPAPIIWQRGGHYDFFVTATMPRSRGAYEKRFATAEEVYEELLHYFFDADSPMRVEEGFVAGPGRPSGA